MSYPPFSKLIPQTDKMLLLSRLVAGSIEEQTLTAEVDITEQTTFFDAGLQGVSATIAVEYMAQTVAAYIGLLVYEKMNPKIGFLIGVRTLTLAREVLPSGSTVAIRVTPDFIDETDAVAAFDCQVTIAGACVAKGALTVFRPEDSEAFLKGLQQ